MEAVFISFLVLAIIYSIFAFGGLTGMIIAFVAVFLFHIVYRIRKGHWFE